MYVHSERSSRPLALTVEQILFDDHPLAAAGIGATPVTSLPIS